MVKNLQNEEETLKEKLTLQKDKQAASISIYFRNEPH
jgi:hypothetical protein